MHNWYTHYYKQSAMTKITTTALTENVTQTQHIKGLPPKPTYTQSNTPSRHAIPTKIDIVTLTCIGMSPIMYNRNPPTLLAYELRMSSDVPYIYIYIYTISQNINVFNHIGSIVIVAARLGYGPIGMNLTVGHTVRHKLICILHIQHDKFTHTLQGYYGIRHVAVCCECIAAAAGACDHVPKHANNMLLF